MVAAAPFDERGSNRLPVSKEEAMSCIINCPDGVVVKGETHDELLANAEAHIREAHPEMVGNVTREELLSQAVTA
jgi:hypothetical protein